MRLESLSSQPKESMTTMEQPENNPEEQAAPTPPVKSAISRKPTQTLPSDRLGLQRWKDIIKAYVVSVESHGGPVDNKEAAKVLAMSDSSIVVTNAFFCDVGIIIRTSSGRLDVSQEAKNYVQALSWNSDVAGHKLKSLFVDKWFSKALLPLLRIRSYSMEEACGVIAEAAGGVGPEYKASLQRIIHFLDFVGLCKLEGDTVSEIVGGPPGKEDEPAGVKPGGDPHVPPADPDKVIPDDAPYLFLDRDRTRKVVLIGPHDLDQKDVERIYQWMKMTYFID